MADFNFSIDKDLFLEFLQEENDLKLSPACVYLYKEFCDLVPDVIRMTNPGTGCLIISDPQKYEYEVRFSSKMIALYKVGTSYIIDYWIFGEPDKAILEDETKQEVRLTFIKLASKQFLESAL